MKAITSEWDLAEEMQSNPGRFTHDQLTNIGRIMANNVTIIRKYEEIIENYKRIVADCENKLKEKRPILCKDCKWYTRPHIEFNDGSKKYFDNEKEMPFVSADIGMIVGGKCIGHKTYCTAHDREDPNDYEELVVFRNTHDYCSYAVRKLAKRKENEE